MGHWYVSVLGGIEAWHSTQSASSNSCDVWLDAKGDRRLHLPEVDRQYTPIRLTRKDELLARIVLDSERGTLAAIATDFFAATTDIEKRRALAYIARLGSDLRDALNGRQQADDFVPVLSVANER